jgi:beta-glucosidase
MGATHDPALSEAEEHVAASETRSTGPQWAFAPCICVARDDRWGRTYESYGEDPALVELMETAIDGFQGTAPTDKGANDRVLATAKHFAGDGLTTYGAAGPTANPLDQGVDQVSMADFARLALAPYVPAVQAHHVGSIMPSYSSVDYTDDGVGNPVKMSAIKSLMTDWLETQTGFDGFLISDYNAIQQIPPLETPAPPSNQQPSPSQIATSINAGMDMGMEPSAYRLYENNLIADASPGAAYPVPMSRIDDAVRRSLTQKFELGLFEHPFTDRTHLPEVGSAAHRAVARQATAESQVLLKNDGGVLPLSKTAHIYLAGSNADDIGNQTGGWTVDWQGLSGNTREQGATSIRSGLAQVAPGATITYSKDASADTAGSDVGVVVVGETPYAEGSGDVKTTPSLKMTLSAADGAAVDKVCGAMKCVVLVVAGRPMLISDRIPEANALVASFLPGSEGAGVADVLFGDKPFTGRLPQSWPRALAQEPINVGDAAYDPQYPFGWGLRTDSATARAAGAANGLTGGDAEAAAARDGLNALAGLATWDKRDVLLRLRGIAQHLDATQFDTWTVDDLVASLARDYAQQAPVTAASSALTSDAEHQLLTGHMAAAVGELSQTAGFATADTPGTVTGSVPATLSLTLGPAATFPAFQPGVDRTYDTSTTADVVSTAGDAALTASGPVHLTNGAFSLKDPLAVDMAPASWSAPVSHGAVAIGFHQHIGPNDPLRTGTYSGTVTFTLSTTNP